MTTTTRASVASAEAMIGGRRSANAAVRADSKPTIANAGATNLGTIGTTAMVNGTSGPVAGATSVGAIAFRGRRRANAADQVGKRRPTKLAASTAAFTPMISMTATTAGKTAIRTNASAAPAAAKSGGPPAANAAEPPATKPPTKLAAGIDGTWTASALPNSHDDAAGN